MKERLLFITTALLIALFMAVTASVFSQELERTKCRSKWGYVDKLSQEVVISCKYEEAKDFSEGLAAVLLSHIYQSSDYWGFIDKTGQVVIPFIFDGAKSFSEGLAAVKFKGNWGFIDKTGKEIISFSFQRAGNFSEGLAAVKSVGKWGFIDKAGNEVIPFNFQNAESFSEGTAAVMNINDYWGFIDKTGNEVLPFRYRKIVTFSDAKAELDSIIELKHERQATQTINSVSTNTFDAILLKDGNEVKAKVLEITDQQIKYKDFDYQSGPTRNISISEVLLIIYENGQKEFFNKKNPSSKKQSLSNCTKKTAFGLDLGIGGGQVSEIFSTALGVRVMHHFNPYFGIDFFKINWITDLVTESLWPIDEGFWTMKLQIMPGFRGNSPTFFKCISVYTAFRLGYGMEVGAGNYGTLGRDINDFKGLCLETELGINISPAFFVGFSYNYHKCYGYNSIISPHTFFTRFGFNFGK
jgi:hypothetical protein